MCCTPSTFSVVVNGSSLRINLRMKWSSDILNYLRRLRGNSSEAVLTRKAGGAFFINALGTAIAFGLQVLLARLLGVTDFGKYIYVITWINLLVMVGKLGLDTTSLRLLPGYSSHGQWHLLRGYVRYSTGVAVMSSVGIGMGLAIVVTVSRDLLEAGLVPVFIIGATLLPLTVFLVLRCVQLQAFRYIVLSQVPQVILRPLLLGLALVVVSVFRDGTVPAGQAMMLNVVTTVLVAVVVMVTARRVLPREFFVGPRERENGIWRGIALPMLLITSFNIVLNQTDMLMVGSLLTAREAGIYGGVSRIAMLIPLAIVLVNLVTAPVIAELYSCGRLSQLQRMTTRVAWGSVVVSMPLFLVVVTVPQNLLRVFGSEFIGGTEALVILACGRLVIALTGSAGYLMSMSDHQKRAAYILGLTAMLDVALCAGLVPRFGIEGAATASTATSVVWCVAMVVDARRMTGISATIVDFQRLRKSA